MIKTAPKLSIFAVFAILAVTAFIPVIASEYTPENPDKPYPEEVLSTEAEYDLNQVIYTNVDEPGVIKADLLDEHIPSDDPITSDVLEGNSPDRVVGLNKRDELRNRMYELQNDPNVLSYQPSYVYRSDLWTTDGTKDTPNDFNASNHWYYEKSRLRELWNDQDCAGAGATCGGDDAVTVAVIDTGLAFEDHTSAWIDEGAPFEYAKIPDMFPGVKLYMNEAELNGVEEVDDDGYDPFKTTHAVIDDINGFDSANFIKCEYHNQCSTIEQRAETGHPNDDGGHGTFVSSMIASLVDNNSGSVGAAHNITLMPIKANFQAINGFGTLELYTAIFYATDKGADVINMSLSGCSTDGLLKAAIDYAVDAGVVVVASSGNYTGDCPINQVNYPAGYSNVIAVGAYNSNNTRSSYSHYGSALDLVGYVGDGATGQSVYQISYSCFGQSGNSGCYEDPNGDSIRSLSPTRYTTFANKNALGTSFAAPQVAAWAALIKSHQPTLNNTEIIQYMYVHAIDVGANGWDNQSGWGAVDYSTGFNDAPTIIITEPNTSQETADVTFNVTWTDDDDDDDAVINLYTDTNSSGEDGLLIGTCQNISEDNEADSCTADVRHLPADEYYVYGCIDDGYNSPVCDYSTGTLDVSHTPATQSGKVSVNHEWKTVTFDTPFSAAPVVVANVVTNYGSDMVYTNIKNITETGFDIQLQENTAQNKYNGLHTYEVVNWYASISSSANETVGVFGLNSASTISEWETIEFSSSFGSVPKVFANVQTENGSHMVYVDIRNVTTDTFQARLTEPPGWDGEHVQEFVGYVVFEDLPSTTQEGTASVDSNWQTITFPTPYSEPPVVISEINTEAGTDQALVEVKDVTITNFRARIEEDPRFDNGTHKFETISWMSIQHTHPISFSMNEAVDSSWTEFAFDEVLASVPNVFTDILSENGPDIVEVDLREITLAGMEIRLEEDVLAGWNGSHKDETVNLRAQVSGTNDGIEVGRTTIDSDWEQISYAGSYTNPIFFAEIQTENGGDTSMVDIRREGTDFYLRVEEDPSAGWNDIHKNETVSWMIMETPSEGCYGTSSLQETGNFVFYDINFADDNTGGDCTFSGTPFLIADINSESGSHTVQVDIKSLTTFDFDLRLEEEITNDRIHKLEDIVWYAWE